MSVKQISVFLENRRGSLAETVELLSKNGVELRALSLADTQDFGVMRFLTSDNETAKNVLREDECIFSENDVVAALMTDEAGGLADVLMALSSRDISVEYIYAFVVKSGECACVIIRADDNENAEKILAEHSFRMLSQEEVNKF